VDIIRREVVNETRIELTGLVPFTHYVFSVSFRNSHFDGPKKTFNFTTDEDGLYCYNNNYYYIYDYYFDYYD